MRVVTAASAIALTLALTLALILADASAQLGGSPGMGGGGHKRNQQQSSSKTAAAKPKADDKAYQDALKSLPDKPYDPWRGAR